MRVCGIVDMVYSKCKRKFSEIAGVKNSNEINIVLDSYNGAQTVNNPKKKATLFLLYRMYLIKE